MDYMESTLRAVAVHPPGSGNCHGAVINWLAKANIITTLEKNALDAIIMGRNANAIYTSILVHKNVNNKLTRAGLRALGPGKVLGIFREGTTDLQHSMITVGNYKLAGANNALTTITPNPNGVGFLINTRHPTNKFSFVKIGIHDDELNWDTLGQAVVTTARSVIHYEHPGVIANRIVRYIAASINGAPPLNWQG